MKVDPVVTVSADDVSHLLEWVRSAAHPVTQEKSREDLVKFLASAQDDMIKNASRIAQEAFELGREYERRNKGNP